MPHQSDRSILSVDLAAVVGNWQQMDRLIGAGREAAAVVKADAYGTGAAHVAPALARAGCQTFFVANAGEALALKSVLDPDRQVLSFAGVPDTETADACRGAWRHASPEFP